jgi:hypothetical protein
MCPAGPCLPAVAASLVADLRLMIRHHEGGIITSQHTEIEQMEHLLGEGA